jgi:hypothetical protein
VHPHKYFEQCPRSYNRYTKARLKIGDVKIP